ncbi:Phage integrase family protein [Methylomagnum ishizawai]|uniref:Phage integrase family protein n=1 Tax=Methylomagnum ishizawai TaxID=1760988 RepID=A0A1Y6DA59_9GAMM|nr:site-specific integrase [Methylomagnum ishizawai]SMF97074.1 Phage integrase family protein [Methylomagnum ishizawai]
MGRAKPHLFGEALSRWLADVSPGNRNHQSNLTHARHLRWPIWADGKFIWLEHLPLEAGPNQLSIVPGMAYWRTDMRQILKRAYIDQRIYHLRQTPDGPAWYRQDPATRDGPPPPRVRVIDPGLLAELDASEGRGPYSPETLRIRQALVRSVLKSCWRDWQLLSADLRTKITLESQGEGRTQWLSLEQLDALIEAAQATEYGQHLADLIDGGASIGWRRNNLVHMTWGQVVWSERDGETLITVGYLILEAQDAKNRKAHYQPLSDHAETLLRRRWECRCGTYVFHSGEGRPFGDFRKTWARILAAAELPEDFHFHDLRHTFFSLLAQAGASDRQMQEIGGHKTQGMVRRYSHFRVDHLRETANLVKRK